VVLAQTHATDQKNAWIYLRRRTIQGSNLCRSENSRRILPSS